MATSSRSSRTSTARPRSKWLRAAMPPAAVRPGARAIPSPPTSTRRPRRGACPAKPQPPRLAAVSDVVVRGEVPPAIRQSVELWIGCVAGALEEQEYRDKLTQAGFEGIDVEPTRVYRVEDARDFLARSGIDADAVAPQVDGKFMSAFVRARKPRAR